MWPGVDCQPDHVPHHQADHSNLYCSKPLCPEEAEIPGHQRTDSPPPFVGVGRGDGVLCRNARKELRVDTEPPPTLRDSFIRKLSIFVLQVMRNAMSLHD